MYFLCQSFTGALISVYQVGISFDSRKFSPFFDDFIDMIFLMILLI